MAFLGTNFVSDSKTHNKIHNLLDEEVVEI